MDEATADLMISWYQNLENQLLDFLNYVPYHQQNINVFSPKLATIITESCGLMDSILKYKTPNPINMSDRKNIKKRNLNIDHYAELYGEKLANYKAILLLSPVQYIQPYSNWLISGITYSNPSPPSLTWWKAHTDIKHDRIDNLELANLNNALYSLCGLFIVIVDNPHLFIKAIHRAGWLHFHYTVEYVYEWALNGYPIRSNGISAVIKTSLFGLPLGVTIPEDINNFSPAFFQGGNVLIPYFGRHI
ncbi:MAG: hypothetical protein CVU90_15635 [Firmicutes bacterium HGW-Firmicutes-15]|nr:MAG: hypothetical protein CVU90_15635 [Firmicutes bacterium HGW-Firmicutes-15]